MAHIGLAWKISRYLYRASLTYSNEMESSCSTSSSSLFIELSVYHFIVTRSVVPSCAIRVRSFIIFFHFVLPVMALAAHTLCLPLPVQALMHLLNSPTPNPTSDITIGGIHTTTDSPQPQAKFAQRQLQEFHLRTVRSQ